MGVQELVRLQNANPGFIPLIFSAFRFIYDAFLVARSQRLQDSSEFAVSKAKFRQISGAINPGLALQRSQELISDYRVPIGEAINRRVAIMFQQLVVCYKTGLQFELGWTSHQAESAPALKVESGGRNHKISKRNAAHSSTIPCLTAFDGTNWFVYMRNADMFRW